MSNELKVILLVLLGIAIVIQFIPSNRPDNDPPAGYDFFEANNVPENVEALIRASCFDCHSQEVNYPWYAYVAPTSWLVSRDVRIGRSQLDFSNWDQLEIKDKLKLAGEIGEEVDMETMPMAIYVLMHREVDLDRETRDLIVEWSEDLAEQAFGE